MRKRSYQHVLSRRSRNTSNPQLQELENRRLYTTINVNSFGAVPDDGQNDMNAIQSALDASSPGDTILFPGGVYNLSGFNQQRHDSDGNGFVIPGDRSYVGENGATLSGSDSKGPLLYPQSYSGNNKVPTNNVTISHLTFDGGGLYIDNVSGFNENFVIDYNVFNMNMSGENRNGITYNSGLKNTRISNNYFTGYNSSFSIYGYSYNTVTIANNELVNVNAGFHMDAKGGSGNLLVEQNYITGAKGMGMEFQGAASNLVFQDNWYEHPNLSNVSAQNDGTMAYSLILDKSSNITIRRNVVITDPITERPDGIGVRIGFEVGGDNSLVEDNYIDGINHTLAMNDGEGTASVIARNNQFRNYLQAASSTFENANPLRHLELINNGPNTDLSATMTARIAANQKPGIGSKRYGDPLPDIDQSLPDAAPTNLSGLAVGTSQIELHWTDNSSNESDFQIQLLSPDGQSWLTVGTVSANGTTFSISSVAAGQSYVFRVVAHNANGYSPVSAPTTVRTPLPDVSPGVVPASRRVRQALIYQGAASSAIAPPMSTGS